MLRKRNLIIGILVAVLAAGGTVGAQLVPFDSVIDRLRADTKGGWVKIDKSPLSPGHQRVYCITLDGYPSCDWNDVRIIQPGAHISKK